MIYIKWALMVPLMLVLTALTYPLAFILPFFAREREGLLNNGTKTGMGWYLPKWLNWFQTPDNSLDGDYGWRTEHWQWRFKLPCSTYVGRVGWLWRNPAYGFGCVMMAGDPILATFSGNQSVNDSPGVEGYCLVHSQGLFQWVWVKRISEGKCLYFNFGWGIKGLIDGAQRTHKASFQFSPRISSWKS